MGRNRIECFERLRPPAAAREEALRLNRVSDRAEQILVDMLAAAERRDAGALLEAAQDATALARQVNPLVREHGLSDCALPPSGVSV